MIQYIDKNINLSSKQDYMIIICEYYIELLSSCYKEIGKVKNKTWSTASLGRLPSFSATES